MPGPVPAGVVTRTLALLRLVGSQCCVGRTDAALRRTVDRDLGGKGGDMGEADLDLSQADPE
jgi:hypothetical protein